MYVRQQPRNRRHAPRFFFAGVTLFAAATVLAGCSDKASTTIASAGTLAANATQAPTPLPTTAATGETIYRNHLASLSILVQSEFTKIGVQLNDPRATDDYIKGLTGSITSLQTQLDLLRRLSPPSEKYLAFDTALDASLADYQTGLTELQSGLQSADVEVIRSAGTKLSAAQAAFKTASATLPPPP